MTTRTDTARRWLEGYIAAKIRISPTEFESIADAPIYELFDSLDLVELLASAEREFDILLDPNRLQWDQHPSVKHLVDQIVSCIGP